MASDALALQPLTEEKGLNLKRQEVEYHSDWGSFTE
jgi:hypothetical protein